MSYQSDTMGGAPDSAPGSQYGDGEPSPNLVPRSPGSGNSQPPNGSRLLGRVHRSLSFSHGQGQGQEYVLKKGGDVFTCGLGTDARLGMGDTLTRIAPRKVPYNWRPGIGAVACGTRFTVAVSREGHVYAWGRNDFGQLGTRTTVDESRPKIVDSLVKRRVVAVAARGSHVVAVTSGGSVFTWGRNDDGQCGLGHVESHVSKPTFVSALEGIHISKVAAGRVHSMAMTKRGDVYTWGAGEDGQLGHVSSLLNAEFRSLSPMRIEGLHGKAAVDIACGSRHSMVVCNGAEVYSWGWNQYGQLGLGDTESRTTPQLVTFLTGKDVESISCGYRHSACITETRRVYTWGWGQSGQLGHGNYANCIVPQLMTGLHASLTVMRVECGGRHTLFIIDNDAGDAYACGRNDDGQLGLGDHESRPDPARVLMEPGYEIMAGAAGWAHTTIISRPTTEFSGRRLQWRDWLRSLFVRGDLDAFFGQMLNGLIVLLLIQSNGGLIGFDGSSKSSDVTRTILPAAGFVLFLGQVLFGLHGFRTMLTTANADTTSLPWGINVVLLTAYLFLIMKPAYDNKRASGATEDEARALAYRVGLIANLTTGVLEIMCLFVVKFVRELVPRVSMLAALAGTSITFITMGFIFQIWAQQMTALLPALIVVTVFASQIRLPLGIPAGFMAILVGIVMAWSIYGISRLFSWDQSFFDPFADGTKLTYEFAFLIPAPKEFGLIFMENFAEVMKTSVQYISVIVPMMLLNLVGNLANLESAEAAGDSYGTFSTLFLDAFMCIVGAVVGNPFPTTVYIGHPGFKQMGARHGYMFLAGLTILALTTFNLMSVVKILVPSEACVAILAWIGVVVTATAFEDEPNVKVKGGVAVAFGMLPAFAAWGANLIDFTIQAGNLKWTDVHDEFKDKLYIDGVLALKQGYLLTSIILSAFVMNVMRRDLLRGALWLFIGAILSAVGLIHAFEVTEQGIGNKYCFGGKYYVQLASPTFFSLYTVAAIMLVFLHCTVVRDDEDNEGGGSSIKNLFNKAVGSKKRNQSFYEAEEDPHESSTLLDVLEQDQHTASATQPLLVKKK